MRAPVPLARGLLFLLIAAPAAAGTKAVDAPVAPVAMPAMTLDRAPELAAPVQAAAAAPEAAAAPLASAIPSAPESAAAPAAANVSIPAAASPASQDPADDSGESAAGRSGLRFDHARADEGPTVSEILRRVRGGQVYVDNNLLRRATNGESKSLRLIQKLPRVEIVSQVWKEYDIDRDGIAKDLAKRNPDMSAKEVRVQSDRQYHELRARERAFRRAAGERLHLASRPAQGGEELAQLLQANLSAEDAAVVAQTMLTCRAKPCYLLSADAKMARGIQSLRAKPERLNAFVRQRRQADPGFPGLELPDVVVVPRPD